MSDPHEIEVKLAASPEMLARLLDDPALGGPQTRRKLSAVYFDTVDWRLQKAGMALRLRTDAEVSEQTLKSGLDGRGGPLVRGEWNAPASGDFPVLANFPEAARSLIEPVVERRRLWAYARIETDRTTRTMLFRDSVIELAFDRVRIVAGETVVDYCELELELVQGSRSDLLYCVLELPLGPGLAWLTSSKSDRGYRLAAGLGDTAIKAQRVVLDAAMTAAQAFRAIAWNCLGHFLANYLIVARAREVEALHQSRVALRRLRAACSIFAELIADDRSNRIRHELRSAGLLLGDGRDLDVLLATLRARDADAEPDPEAAADLLVELGRQRERAYDRIVALVRSEPFQRLLFETALWIEDGAWAHHGSARVIDFAAGVLRRRRRKIRHALGTLDTLAPDERHRLRIAVKKLRYAAEFFATLFRTSDGVARAQKSFAAALAALQDRLGELNDIATGRDAVRTEFPEHGDIDRTRLADALDHMLEAKDGAEQLLLQAADEAGADAMAAGRYWKH